MDENRMMAQVIEEPYRMVTREVPIPEPGDDELLVKVRVAGLSADDWSLFRGALGEGTLPAVPGCEFWGDVEAVGSAVTGIRVGDRVASLAGPASSLTCLSAGGSQLQIETFTQAGCPGQGGWGGLAQYALVRGADCCILPADMDDYTAVFVRPLASVIRAFDHLRLEPAAACIISGNDASVVLYAAYARLRGAAPVIVVSKKPGYLQCALQMGADYAIHGEDTSGVAAEIRKITEDTGVGCVLEIPEPAAAHRRAGSVLGDGDDGDSRLGRFYLEVLNGGTTQNSGEDSWRRALALLQYQHINPKPMWSVAVPLRHAEDAFKKAFQEEDLTKVFVVPTLREDFVFPSVRRPLAATIEPQTP